MAKPWVSQALTPRQTIQLRELCSAIAKHANSVRDVPPEPGVVMTYAVFEIAIAMAAEIGDPLPEPVIMAAGLGGVAMAHQTLKEIQR